MRARWLSAGLFAMWHGIIVGAVPVVPPDLIGAKQPQVCVDAQDNILVAFGKENTIYCAASADRGKTFSRPEPVAQVDKLALGMRRGPRIVATAHHKIVSAISSETGNLHVWSSVDGKKWTAHGLVNDSKRAAREGLHAMASDGNKRVFVTWLDLRSGQTEIWGALSEDEGKTWKKNVRVYHSPDGHVCECCHPSVVFSPSGAITVMWRNWLNGSRDMYLATSQDGRNFSSAQKCGTGSWSLKGCPMDGGALAIGPDQKVVSIWRREKDIFSATDSLSEKRLGTGLQPIVVAAKHKLVFVWQDGLRLVAQNDTGSVLSELAGVNGRYPAAASAGPDKPAVVVWESAENGKDTIMAEVIK